MSRIITRYEVCTTCCCCIANDDSSGMDDAQWQKFTEWSEDKGYLTCSDDAALGDSCEACGYSDYDGAFHVVEGVTHATEVAE
jgi:hypothetical protein